MSSGKENRNNSSILFKLLQWKNMSFQPLFLSAFINILRYKCGFKCLYEKIVDELLQITTKFILLWYVWLNGPTICQHRKEFTFILIKSKARPKLPNTKCRSLHLTFNVCSAKNCTSKIVAKKMLTKMSTKTIGRNYHIFNNMHFFDFLHR